MGHCIINGVRFSTPDKYIGRYDALLFTNLPQLIQPLLFVSLVTVAVYVPLWLSYKLNFKFNNLFL